MRNFHSVGGVLFLTVTLTFMALLYAPIFSKFTPFNVNAALIISDITVTNITENSANINWNTDQLASSVVNYGLSTTALLKAGAPGFVTNHVVTLQNLQPGSLYYFRVSSKDATGSSSSSPFQTFNTVAGAPDTIPPSVPTNLSASAASSSQINLSWNASTDNIGVTGYTIYRNGSQVTTSASPSYSDTGLLAETTYSYTVAAFDAAGNASSQSTSVSATTLAGSVSFAAMPLMDMTSGQNYKGFEGGLYENSSTTAPADHDADGRMFASQIQPLDASGNASPDGKIGVIGIGMSNWTMKLCVSRDINQGTQGTCTPNSFMSQMVANANVNHTTMVFVDCAANTQVAKNWIDNAKGNYTKCDQLLSQVGLTPAQVQVVMYEDANPNPQKSLTASTPCVAGSTEDACFYENLLGRTARYVKQRYLNTKQMFLHSRTYGGYATGALNPEPYAYEYGLSTKWLIQAQINQIRTGTVNQVAGNLSYTVAPWMAWGPYFWASGTTPRSDGLTWESGDFVADGIHPSESGVLKVSNMMMDFYLNSSYSPWFRATP